MPKILFWFRIGKMWKSFWCLLNPGPTGWTWSKPTMCSWLSRFSTPPTSCKPSAEFIVWDKRGQQRFTDSSSKTPWRREFITCFKSKQIILTTLDQFQFEQMIFLVNWSFINWRVPRLCLVSLAEVPSHCKGVPEKVSKVKRLWNPNKTFYLLWFFGKERQERKAVLVRHQLSSIRNRPQRRSGLPTKTTWKGWQCRT